MDSSIVSCYDYKTGFLFLVNIFSHKWNTYVCIHICRLAGVYGNWVVHTFHTNTTYRSGVP